MPNTTRSRSESTRLKFPPVCKDFSDILGDLGVFRLFYQRWDRLSRLTWMSYLPCAKSTECQRQAGINEEARAQRGDPGDSLTGDTGHFSRMCKPHERPHFSAGRVT